MTEHFLSLCDADLRSLSTALRTERLTLPINTMALQRLVAGHLVPTVSRDLQAFADKYGLLAHQFAATIDLVLEDRKRRRVIDDEIDFVTTGPEPDGVTNRDTSVVVREMFSNAVQSVLVAGYAVYQGHRVFEALADRMQELPGLKVQLFLDIQRPKDVTIASEDLVSKFKHRFLRHQWPAERPIPDLYYYPASLDISDKHSCLHAKCVVVDRRDVFISSANFTEAAQERNIELGVLLHSKLFAQQVTKHFDSLVVAGEMRRLV